ncbi:MAG: biotin/lipoyl-containing protein, partial [Bacillota bacterium]|nr:biotin/lipoyl-containing protein [Bacillota bacterium]
MATPVIMPRQGQSVESCIIGSWHKQKGDPVKAGDILFTYETDKATFDETAKVDGTLIAVFFAEGDDVPCLTNVCVIGQPGEDTSSFNPGGDSASAAEPAAAQESAPEQEPAPEPAAKKPGKAAGVAGTAALPEAISPRAKHLADKSGADLR